MTKPRLQARFAEDRAEEVEEFAQENNISKSDALRRLVRRGLETERTDEEDEDEDETTDTSQYWERGDLAARFAILFAVIGIAVGYVPPLSATFVEGSRVAATFASMGLAYYSWYNAGKIIGARLEDSPFLSRIATRVRVCVAYIIPRFTPGGFDDAAEVR